jgi:type IV pilus assembly protein PilW
MRRRGFTLVEILIALAVSALALAAAIAAANAQQRAFYTGQKSRAAQGSGRAALLFLERTLPLAGFGMDAPLAVDFGWYDRSPVCPAALAPCSPDRTDDADELVYYARNPNYWVPEDAAGEPRGRAWHIASFAPDEVTVRARGGDVFRRGQILQAVCVGQGVYAYFTVATTVAVPAATPTTDLEVELQPVVLTNPFRRQDVAAAQPCLLAGGRLFQIDRHRLHVRPVAAGGRTDPYLVLDTGTDTDGDGDVDPDDEMILADGIEAFQVSYVFSNPALPVAGAVQGTPVALRAGLPADQTAQAITPSVFPGVLAPGQFVYAPSSFYRLSLLPPVPSARLTNHQGNLRTVRVALVARSPEPDPAASANLTWTAGSPLLRHNQDRAPAWVPVDGGYQRAVLETAVNLANMNVRGAAYF